MSIQRFMYTTLIATTVGAIGLAQSASAPGPSVATLATRPLAGISGKEGMLLTVDYPPGGNGTKFGWMSLG